MMSRIDNWFTQRFVLKRLISEEDWSEDTYLTIGAFKGFIQPLSSVVAVSSGKNTYTLTHKLFCDYHISVLLDDLIIYEGHQYVVRAYQLDGISGMSSHQEIGVEFVDGNQD